MPLTIHNVAIEAFFRSWSSLYLFISKFLFIPDFQILISLQPDVVNQTMNFAKSITLSFKYQRYTQGRTQGGGKGAMLPLDL